MNYLSSLFAVVFSFAITSCLVVEDGATTAPANPGSGMNSESDAGPPGWQAGYEKGMADGAGGLSRTPDRYSYIYSEADRSGFFSGYEAGYNRGIKP